MNINSYQDAKITFKDEGDKNPNQVVGILSHKGKEYRVTMTSPAGLSDMKSTMQAMRKTLAALVDLYKVGEGKTEKIEIKNFSDYEKAKIGKTVKDATNTKWERTFKEHEEKLKKNNKNDKLPILEFIKNQYNKESKPAEIQPKPLLQSNESKIEEEPKGKEPNKTQPQNRADAQTAPLLAMPQAICVPLISKEKEQQENPTTTPSLSTSHTSQFLKEENIANQISLVSNSENVVKNSTDEIEKNKKEAIQFKLVLDQVKIPQKLKKLKPEEKKSNDLLTNVLDEAFTKNFQHRINQKDPSGTDTDDSEWK